MHVKHKKAAMFGLDARIALAIFGTLSVISGAALYNIIQHTKAVRLLTELREVGKAWEQFYLDTGVQFVPSTADTSSNNYHIFKTQEIRQKQRAGWKGPYLPKSFIEECPYNVDKCIIGIYRYDNAEWTSSSWSTHLCQSGKDCGIWARAYVRTTGMNEPIAKRIDEIVDNGDGPLEGDFRWWESYELKIAPATNPYD